MEEEEPSSLLQSWEEGLPAAERHGEGEEEGDLAGAESVSHGRELLLAAVWEKEAGRKKVAARGVGE